MARGFTAGGTDKITTALIQTAPFSLAAWIYVTNLAIPNSIMGSVATGDIDFYSKATPVNGTITLDKRGIIECGQSTGQITASTWAHAGVSFDGSNNFAFYINGVLSGSGNGGTNMNGNNSIMIGNTGTAGTSAMGGRIADAAVWNTILTSGEFSALGGGIRAFNIRPKSIKFFLPIYGDVSPEPDMSGNINNGTVIGTTFVNGPPMTLFTPKPPSKFDLPLGAQIYSFDQMSAHITRKITNIGY